MKRSAKPECADGMDTALGSDLLLPYCCQDPSSMSVGSSLFIDFAGKIKSRRAETNRLPLLQTRVIGQALQGVAQECKSRISKLVSILRLAACCTVVRSQ
jgi:hypothetical protein